MQIHNFYAGPAILPREVIEQAAEATLNFNNTGLSLLEISHRSKEFISVMDEAVELVRSILQIPEDFAVLFLSGGASSQFFMAPMNLLDADMKAAYTDTGTWANKAIKDAKLYGHVDVISSSKEDNYTYIPKIGQVDPSYRYLHITSNNTIYGTQYQHFPNPGIPMVADMSSDIFSRPFDISAFDLVYAGAQKNMGPAGTTLVIVRKSALGKVNRPIPAMLSYANHIESGSMYNTPPVFPVYVSMLTLRWINKLGGIDKIRERNEIKASALYSEIDRNGLFYSPVNKEDQSRMNVCFLLHNRDLEKEFLSLCKEAGCVGLEGHRSVGGFRASIYNAMELSSIEVLIGVMREFERVKG